MDLRRVQETGGTYLISLPKGWAKRVGLNRGSVVAMVEREDGSLIVDPQYKLVKEAEPATISSFHYLEREITGNYLLGFNTIHINGRGRLPSDVRERVREAVRRLVGLEIVEEDASRIVLQCLLEPSSFPPERILRREFLLASSMHRDVMVAFFEGDEPLAKLIVERDEEVDRLYFLIVRLLRTVVLNPRLSESMNIRLIDCLDYRLVASLIESIGDRAEEIAQNVLTYSSKVSLPSEVLQSTRLLGDASFEMCESAVRAIFSRDLELANRVIEKNTDVKATIHELDNLLARRSPDVITYASEVVSSIARMCDYSVDIADLVMPKRS